MFFVVKGNQSVSNTDTTQGQLSQRETSFKYEIYGSAANN